MIISDLPDIFLALITVLGFIYGMTGIFASDRTHQLRAINSLLVSLVSWLVLVAPIFWRVLQEILTALKALHLQ